MNSCASRINTTVAMLNDQTSDVTPVSDRNEPKGVHIINNRNNKVSIQFEFNSQIECIIGYCEFGENEFSIKIDDTEGFYPKEQIVMEFERRSIKEYYATHA